MKRPSLVTPVPRQPIVVRPVAVQGARSVAGGGGGGAAPATPPVVIEQFSDPKNSFSDRPRLRGTVGPGDLALGIVAGGNGSSVAPAGMTSWVGMNSGSGGSVLHARSGYRTSEGFFNTQQASDVGGACTIVVSGVDIDDFLARSTSVFASGGITSGTLSAQPLLTQDGTSIIVYFYASRGSSNLFVTSGTEVAQALSQNGPGSCAIAWAPTVDGQTEMPAVTFGGNGRVSCSRMELRAA